MQPAVETRGLTKTYSSSLGPVQAVREVTMAIPRGELFGLFGSNGAGKSTLIHLLATLLLPTAGEAHVNGLDVVTQAAAVRSHIGLVFSNEHSFYGRLTGRQNLDFFATLQNLARRDIRGRVDELLELFDLQRAANRPFQTYSTGMRQKLNMARALLHNPPVLFLDEPTKGMDLLTAESVRALLKQEIVGRQGKTVFLTTHDLPEMERMCDRVGVLARGRLRAFGELKAELEQARAEHVYRVELAAPVPGLSGRLAALPPVHAIEGEGAQLDITTSDAPRIDELLWNEIEKHGGQIHRYGPRDEGLYALLRRIAREENN